MEFEYEVALSFAEQDRQKADLVANELKANGINIFYDKFEKHKLWGKNLFDHLTEIYSRKARYCVIFVSEHYLKNTWTNLERRAAQERSLTEENEYILPVLIDDVKMPGMLSTVAYLKWNHETAASITALIKAKILHKKDEAGGQQRTQHPVNWKTIAPVFIETFDEGDTAYENIDLFKDKLLIPWLPSNEAVWQSDITNGNLVLSNQADGKAVRYRWFRIKGVDMSRVIISAEIKLDKSFGAPLFGAGLVYRFQEDTKDYYAFVLNGEKLYGLYHRHAGNFTTLYSGRSNAITMNEFNRIAIGGDKIQLFLYINEALVLTFPTNLLLTGSVGIIAMGGGEFRFDNVMVYGEQ